MATDQTSKLGIYLRRGENTSEDVFYYATNDPEYWIMVPASVTLRPSRVHRPEEDREDWVAIGAYNDSWADVVITTELLAKHTRRIVEGLLYMAKVGA